MEKIIIYTDGGSRGNPGPAGIGVVIKGGKGKIKNTEIEFRLDSQLIARQLNGEYKIEEERLFPLFIKIWNLKMNFGPIKFSEIPRERNKEADKLANEAMDGNVSSSLKPALPADRSKNSKLF